MLLLFAGKLCELTAACLKLFAASGDAMNKFGDAIRVRGSAGGDALQFDCRLVGDRAGFTDLRVERVAVANKFLAAYPDLTVLSSM